MPRSEQVKRPTNLDENRDNIWVYAQFSRQVEQMVILCEDPHVPDAAEPHPESTGTAPDSSVTLWPEQILRIQTGAS